MQKMNSKFFVVTVWNFIGNKNQNQLVPWQIYIIQNVHLLGLKPPSSLTQCVSVNLRIQHTTPLGERNAFRFNFYCLFSFINSIWAIKDSMRNSIYCLMLKIFFWIVWCVRQRFLITLKITDKNKMKFFHKKFNEWNSYIYISFKKGISIM